MQGEAEEERAGESMRGRTFVAVLGCILVAGLSAIPSASAYRPPLVHAGEAQPEEWLPAGELAKLPTNTEKQIEGACGLAISPSGTLYVSDYYHRDVHSFTLASIYL